MSALAAEFKPRLEKILQDAVIVSEVAVVAQEAALLVKEELSCDQALDTLKKAGLPRTPSATKALPRIRFGSVTFENQGEVIDVSTSHDSDEDDNNNNNSNDISLGKVVDSSPVSLQNLGSPDATTLTAADSEPGEEEGESPTDASELPSSVPARRARHPALTRTESGNFRIKEMLDRWEEPPTKAVKVQ